MSESYPALTIWQPWATLIAEGMKPFEFRGWAPHQAMWERRIAIHAGARPVRRDEVVALLLQLQSRYPGSAAGTGLVRHAEAIALLQRISLTPRSLPLSAVLCTAQLGVPIRNHQLAAAMGVDLINDSDRDEHTNWGWPLTEIERLEPFMPARGAQGFWTWRRPG